MTRFLSLFATSFAFLVVAVAAIPQDHLAPAAHSGDSFIALESRDDPSASVDYLAGETGLPLARVMGRQVHNADYGSNNGPSGNPQTGQETEEEANSPTPEANDSESYSAGDDTSKMRRDFDHESSHEISYEDLS